MKKVELKMMWSHVRRHKGGSILFYRFPIFKMHVQ